jgi:hypothetical protein
MTKTEHLQFLVLMIPTFIILVAAAVSLADLALPATADAYTLAAAEAQLRPQPAVDDRTYE